jgi:ribose transport system permease protein
MKMHELSFKTIRQAMLKNVVSVMIVVFIIFMAFKKPAFVSWENIANIINQFSIYGITACAMTAAIICGEFDLSASSVFAWSTVLCVLLCNSIGFFPAVLLTLLCGAAFGALNGFLVSVVKIPAFVATLGTMTAIRGLAFVVTDAQPVNTTNAALKAFGQFSIVGLSSAPMVFLLTVLVFIWFMKKTPGGRAIYATGGNYEVARLSGIKVRRSKALVFILLGACAALSGIMYSSRIMAGWAPYGSDLSLYCVAATVIGGTSLSGGRGGVHRTIIGVLLMGIMFSALTMLGVSGSMQKFIQGLVLITVIMTDAIVNKRLKA